MLIEKALRHKRIDKSVLPFGEEARIVDQRYRDSAEGEACEVDPSHDRATVVGCHPRVTLAGGVSLKPSDDLIIRLCFNCHKEQEPAGAVWLATKILFPLLKISTHEPDEQTAYWMVKNMLFPILRRRYQVWKAKR